MADDAIATDIDEDLAELAIVPPTEFTATRNERAKALRAAKQRERAALVAKLPKPTWTAWALNVLARREPDALAAWFEAGDALDAALGGGDRDVLREAQQAERATLADTIDRAHAVLAEAGRSVDDQTAQKLTGTLRAAITDADVRDRLARGVLDDDVEAPTFGFGFAAPSDTNVVTLDSQRAKRSARSASRSATTSGTGTRRVKEGSGEKRSTSSDDDAAARARAEAERRAVEAAEAEARRVEAERRAAERSRLEAELQATERELDTRTAAAGAAEEAALTARAAADAAAVAAGDARAAVEAAREALEALEALEAGD